jgi:MFS family permease
LFSSLLRAFRHRNYRLFFAGQLVSLVGTWMQSVALAWLVYRLTGSATVLGLVGFAGQIPVFLLSPVGGAVADRFNRHALLIWTQVASMVLALALAALTLAGTLEMSHLFALAALLGVVNAFDIPARQSFVVEMVGREDLVNAIALNSSMFNGARLVGPAIAGVMVATIGEGWCFFVNGVSYLGVIAGLLAMRIERADAVAAHGSPLTSVVEGFRYVAHTGPIRALLLLLGVLSFVGMPYAVLMPIFADSILSGGPSGLGLLMGASGAGALVGALVLAGRQGIAGLGGWVAGAAFLFGFTLIVFALSRAFWMSVVILVATGFFMIVALASSNTLIQSMVPDRLRGRVMSVYSMMFMGMAPFGSLAAGAVAERLGAPAAVALGGAACMATALVFGSRLSALRLHARQLILAQQAAGGEPPQATTGQVAGGE